MKFNYACYITEKDGLYQPVLSTIMESEGDNDSFLYTVGTGPKTETVEEAKKFLKEGAPPEASMFLDPVDEKGANENYWLSEFKDN